MKPDMRLQTAVVGFEIMNFVQGFSQLGPPSSAPTEHPSRCWTHTGNSFCNGSTMTRQTLGSRAEQQRNQAFSHAMDGGSPGIEAAEIPVPWGAARTMSAAVDVPHQRRIRLNGRNIALALPEPGSINIRFRKSALRQFRNPR